ncbi:MAG: bifunctional DNA-formamidopyrimidine glycosylase/DNA-(apurinic or apyrimidinic site) lyase [Candidatus Omnitrophica bacterium]|nr:bifunctional DNA-formamidopyrimidine glycosylase/DNA-(apurinic or apyrimidinic site) lyase [Candidatus Omnitrophota bacterium]
MPELPEVETIKRDLDPLIRGKTITAVTVSRSTVIKEPGVRQFKRLLLNARCRRIFRRGKLLVVELDSAAGRELFLTVHLKMTGQLVIGPADPKSRVSFHLSDGMVLSYNDQRALGELRVVKDWRLLNVVRGMGPEPLSAGFTAEMFARELHGRSTKIKPLLLDQTFIAGIGNIYAAEALFLSKIAPQRKANTLSQSESKRLFKNIRSILEKAIQCRGSSFNNYRDGLGKKGTFTRHFTVYSRKGEPCVCCKEPIRKMTLGGRGTYFCAQCQK